MHITALSLAFANDIRDNKEFHFYMKRLFSTLIGREKVCSCLTFKNGATLASLAFGDKIDLETENCIFMPVSTDRAIGILSQLFGCEPMNIVAMTIPLMLADHEDAKNHRLHIGLYEDPSNSFNEALLQIYYSYYLGLKRQKQAVDTSTEDSSTEDTSIESTKPTETQLTESKPAPFERIPNFAKPINELWD